MGSMFSYIQRDSINLISNHWFKVEARYAKWFGLQSGHFGKGFVFLGVLCIISFQVDCFRLNVGKPCLGFTFSYIQPDSINLKSNHWFQCGSQHAQ